MKRVIAAIILILAITLAGCSKGGGESTELSFSDAVDISVIEKLDGKEVSIIGYMATLSPVSGRYIYLMNLPYQSCPFCVPNTTQLANTMAVYAAKGEKFEYTDQAIRVKGKMEVGDFTDDYGYVYNYRIVDAAYEEIDLSSISSEYALWVSIAEDGIIADVNSMLNYVYFVCQWTEYTSSMEDENGNTITYYLYPGDTENYLADDGPYGYANFATEGYFDGLISRVKAISETELEELSAIISDAAALEKYARSELTAQNYTYDKFADKYELNNAADILEKYDKLYARFSAWLNKWEV